MLLIFIEVVNSALHLADVMRSCFINLSWLLISQWRITDTHMHRATHIEIEKQSKQ